MWNFLLKIDPNTLIAVATAIGGIVTWSYHKIRGDKQDSFMDTFTGLGKQVIHAVMSDPSINNDTNFATLKALVTQQIWSLATLAHIPRNAISEAIANQVIEHTVGDILTELRTKAEAQKTIDNLPTLDQVRQWFVPKPLIPGEGV